ncbi:MAG: hypothetical protein JWP58_2869 [Hymenobacter sp.]|nr:hypothetical protein [Hymenobacter sp.]
MFRFKYGLTIVGNGMFGFKYAVTIVDKPYQRANPAFPQVGGQGLGFNG